MALLLEKLRIEFTKYHPRHSNDNALAESKNGAVVRKHLGLRTSHNRRRTVNTVWRKKSLSVDSQLVISIHGSDKKAVRIMNRRYSSSRWPSASR